MTQHEIEEVLMTSQERQAKEPSHAGETVINNLLQGVMPTTNADSFLL